jgi:hypothetical protein
MKTSPRGGTGGLSESPSSFFLLFPILLFSHPPRVRLTMAITSHPMGEKKKSPFYTPCQDRVLQYSPNPLGISTEIISYMRRI